MIANYAIPILFIVFLASIVLWGWWRSGQIFCAPLPRPFRQRNSQEAIWRQAYRDDNLEKAEALLATLCEAFCFNPDDRYQFALTDRIMEIYRARYPRWQFWNLADSMELEEFMVALSEQFGIEDAELGEMTLGEIVETMKPMAPSEGIHEKS